MLSKMPFTALHPTLVVGQRPNHPLFQVIDWDRVLGGDYAVVDPMDPSAILYLSEKEYKIQVRVSQSSDTKLIVLATAGSDKQAALSHYASSQNSPLARKPRFQTKGSFLKWHNTRYQGIVTRQPDGTGIVKLDGEILQVLLYNWAWDAYVKAGGSPLPSSRFRLSLQELVQECTTLLSTRGKQSFILRFKNALFFMNKFLAGQAGSNPWSLGEPVGLTNNGLPRLIPLYFRRSIAAGDKATIRMFSTLFASYKAFEGEHDLQDLASVTGPLPQLDQFTLEEFKTFCKKEFWKVVKSYGAVGISDFKLDKLRLSQDGVPYIPLRAGPNHKVGLMGAVDDAFAWSKQTRNLPMEWAQLLEDNRTISLMNEVVSRANTHLTTFFEQKIAKEEGPYTSKISLLAEPAGKVRTIAIVDYWTQRLMSPVHKWMEGALRALPTDATFDQDGTVATFASRFRDQTFYSIDLKSATDLIPITLYKALFEGIWGEKATDLWIDLLTARDFLVPKGSRKNPSLARPNLRGSLIRYGRGQPMGTLSSWPSMALVHHALVLFSAKKAGVDPLTFTEYRILGDDNVLANTVVANMYLQVTERLCVPTSPSKSLIGKAFIFASQIWRNGICLSPMSLKEEIGVSSFTQRLETALRAVRRGWIEDKPTIARFLRLLLSPSQYLRSREEFSKGKLGNVARLALIATFGTSGRLLSTLGIKGSGIKTCLLALANKVESVAGRESTSLADSKLSEINRGLAIAIVTNVIREAGHLVNKLRRSSQYWGDLRAGFSETGTIATSSRPGPRGRPILNIPYKNDLQHASRAWTVFNFFSKVCKASDPDLRKKVPWLPEVYLDTKFLDFARAFHTCLWPVIEDSLTPIFGRMADDDPVFTELAEYEENEGTYMGIVADFTGIPPIIREVEQVIAPLKKILDELVSSPDISPIPEVVDDDIWEKVDQALDLYLKISRLPDLSNGIHDLSTTVRDPIKVDALREWVRRTRCLHSAVASWNPVYSAFADTVDGVTPPTHLVGGMATAI